MAIYARLVAISLHLAIEMLRHPIDRDGTRPMGVMRKIIIDSGA